jgi:hypothetical protein
MGLDRVDVELDRIISDIADALVLIDSSGTPFKTFQPGVGPYGEPQLVRLVAQHLSTADAYRGRITTKRTPDLMIKGLWALEFKIARPFGDNGKEAENLSVNLLHPYPGNVSVIGDCLKLLALDGSERKAAVVVGYEHAPAQISLAPLLAAFEIVAKQVAKINLSQCVQVIRGGLRHPVHQQLTVAAWEILEPVV